MPCGTVFLCGHFAARRLNQKYKEFSKAAGLPEQRERMKAYVPIEKEKITQNTSIREIGEIDRDKFEKISTSIRSKKVIITEERIQHIRDHHPGDYEKYESYIKEMLQAPQYILADDEENTAVILQEFSGNDEHFRLIMKLAVFGDDTWKENSVITFLKISKKKFNKYLRNKKVLYKSE